MSINDELSILSVNKANIYDAIVSKGVTPEKNGFGYFATAINGISNVFEVTQISQIQLENKPKGTCYLYKPYGTTLSRIIIYLLDSNYVGYEGNPEWYVFSFDSTQHIFNMLGLIIGGQISRVIEPSQLQSYTFNNTIDFSMFSINNSYPYEAPMKFTSGNAVSFDGIVIDLDSSDIPKISYYVEVDGNKTFTEVFANNAWVDASYKMISFSVDSYVDPHFLLWLLCDGSFNAMALYHDNIVE